MMKVMIVDDEPAHRFGLAQHVNWKALGYEQPVLAEDGEEALALAGQDMPEVLIADVCMPGMDGITLVKEMRRRVPELQVLIISGFEEFEFARGAVEAGAAAYILKPLKTDEVVGWMETFRDRILARHARRAEEETFRQKLRDSQQIARRRFLEELVRRQPEGDARQSEGNALQSAGDALQSAGNVLQPASDALQSTAAEQATFEQRLVHQARQLDFSEGSKRLALVCFEREVGAFVTSGSASPAALSSAEIENCVERILSQSIRATVETIITMGNDVLALLASPHHVMNSDTEPEDVFATRSGDDLSSLLAIRLRGALQASGVAFSVRIGVPAMRWTELSAQYRTLRDNPRSAEPQSATVSRTVQDAMRHLSSNLSDGITLDELAARVHMNPSYLSVLFKKETGETISDHVARLRIEQARALLLDGRKIYDVARLVGYQNASFFSRQFQKAVGVSPVAFRKYGSAAVDMR